ncbi:hypothetical protein KAU19_03985 [Candidatus Parcubacteria bacterium]|nr:hypothetical protein [Candidatus Parcubacteria bacterium]
MKKLFTFLLIAAVSVTLSSFALTNQVSADTEVHKNITVDTTWTVENSPYVLTKTIEVEYGDTLTIEPGVTVKMPGAYDDMFLLKGEIIAVGTADNKITFDAGGNSDFFNAQNSRPSAFLDLDYCVIKNGGSFWKHGYGYFSLKNSLIENLSGRSYLASPENDVYIEYNEFKNIGGFSTAHGGDTKVYIRYNLFDTKNPDLPSYDDYLIQNTASYDQSETIVEYNSFINSEGIVLELPGGYGVAALSAPNNYWGTQDESIIDEMIYDKNDNKNSAGYIEYAPILTEPHPDSPAIAGPTTPTINSVTSPTIDSTQAISGTKDADSSIWMNEEEIIPLDSLIEWNYNLSLIIGENNIEIIAKNSNGIKSAAATTTIIRISEEAAEEEEITEEEVKEVEEQPEPVVDSRQFIEQEKELVAQVDNKLSARLSGNILLQVEEHGEAWYVYPNDKKKYYLGRPADAFNVMKNLGLGATHEFITSHTTYPSHVLGKILLDVEQNGEAYYINPKDKKAYYLGRPADAFSIMRELGLGITNQDIRKIEVGEIN